MIVKLFFSDKTNRPTKTYLKKNDKILYKDYKAAQGLSSFFVNAVKALYIKPKGFTLSETFSLNNPVEFAIKKFESHPSISNIKENIPVDHLFQLEHHQVSEILEEISELGGSKNGTIKNIPSNRLKETSDVCAPNLTRI